MSKKLVVAMANLDEDVVAKNAQNTVDYCKQFVEV